MHRRQTEETFVFPVEGRGVMVNDAVDRSCRVESLAASDNSDNYTKDFFSNSHKITLDLESTPSATLSSEVNYEDRRSQ